MDSFTPLYQRTQVEEAIWQAWRAPIVNAPKQMPRVMETRIKKLLELDSSLFSETAPGFAFSSNQELGQGVLRSFSVFDCFCLCVALQMIDHGMAQTDVVYISQHIRPVLLNHFDKLCALSISALRNVLDPSDYPDLPVTEFKDQRVVDKQVFLCFSPVEFDEAYGIKKKKLQNSVTVFGPEIYYGVNAFASQMQMNAGISRHMCLIEIRSLACHLAEILPTLPARKRGRPADKRKAL